VERDGDQQVIDIIAAEVGVAVGGDDFENAVVQLEYGNVEGAAAEIVDGNDAVLLFVQAVRQGGGRGFVHQAEDFQSSNASGVFSGLALGVVEVCRYGDHGFADRRGKVSLGIALELAQDQR